MKRLSFLLLLLIYFFYSKGQGISGPSNVSVNVNETYINTYGAGSDSDFYYWDVSGGSSSHSCEDSLIHSWSSVGVFNVTLMCIHNYNTQYEFHQEMDNLSVEVGDAIVIKYNYDKAGNRKKREVIYYSEYIDDKKSIEIPSLPEEDEMEEGYSNLYPNPARNSINVVLSSDILEVKSKRIVIYDFNGRKLKEVIPYTTYNEINISDLKSGTYIVKLFFGNKSRDWKLIKQ